MSFFDQRARTHDEPDEKCMQHSQYVQDLAEVDTYSEMKAKKITAYIALMQEMTQWDLK